MPNYNLRGLWIIASRETLVILTALLQLDQLASARGLRPVTRTWPIGDNTVGVGDGPAVLADL
jgi:hypothetical protein